MNNKVKFLRGTSGEYAVAEKDNDTIYFTTDDGRLYIGDKEISGSDIIIDDTLSDTSTNPVQNKVVKQAIDNKADKTIATTSADGLMSAEDKSKLDDADNTYALKSKYGDTTINVGRKEGSDIGERSTAEGYNTIASGSYSHAEGAGTMAYGECSHAEGSANKAIGERSHAEGLFTTAYGNYSHIEGQSISPIMSSIPNYFNDLKNMSDDEIISNWNNINFSLAKGLYSHVEGVNSLALGNGSHAEGDCTIAKGICSHSGGADSLAEGAESFSHGQSTKSSNQGEASFGRYNKSSSDTLFSVGDGASDSARHNAFEITKTGGKLHDKDIAVDVSNPNLLINPDFKINQRGVSGTFSKTGKYLVDRWRLVSGTVTVNADSTLTLNGTISQVFENAVGDNVSASVSAGTATYNDSTKTFSITANGETVSWAKLEHGGTATQFIPPDPATELLRCMRYYEILIPSGADRAVTGYLETGRNALFDMKFSVPKRCVPSLTSNSARIIVNTFDSYLAILDNCPVIQGETDKHGIVIASTDPVISSVSSGYIGVTMDAIHNAALAVDAEIY